MSTATEQRINAVMASHPTLTTAGFERKSLEFLVHRADMMHPAFLKEFEAARTWLSLVPHTAKPNLRMGHSYKLKHVCENWAGHYISNGAMIAAAIDLGVAVAQMGNSLNAHIGVGDRRKWPVSNGFYGNR